MPVRESRDHRLFDSYPRLIAAFRALQSLLTPRHPPCALCSLTTRIECSREKTHESRTGGRHSSDHRPAGKTALQNPASRQRHHLRFNVYFSFLSLGRIPPRLPFRKRKGLQRHSLQDASYHNQIVKEQHKPTPQGPQHHLAEPVPKHQHHPMMTTALPSRSRLATSVMDRGSTRHTLRRHFSREQSNRASTHGSSHEPSQRNRRQQSRHRRCDE